LAHGYSPGFKTYYKIIHRKGAKSAKKIKSEQDDELFMLLVGFTLRPLRLCGEKVLFFSFSN